MWGEYDVLAAINKRFIIGHQNVKVLREPLCIPLTTVPDVRGFESVYNPVEVDALCQEVQRDLPRVAQAHEYSGSVGDVRKVGESVEKIEFTPVQTIQPPEKRHLPFVKRETLLGILMARDQEIFGSFL